MAKNNYLKWLRCLSKITEMVKFISWDGIANLIFNLKFQIFMKF
jgi:hypothetical protein